jgi:hypothetical protein
LITSEGLACAPCAELLAESCPVTLYRLQFLLVSSGSELETRVEKKIVTWETINSSVICKYSCRSITSLDQRLTKLWVAQYGIQLEFTQGVLIHGRVQWGDARVVEIEGERCAGDDEPVIEPTVQSAVAASVA